MDVVVSDDSSRFAHMLLQNMTQTSDQKVGEESQTIRRRLPTEHNTGNYIGIILLEILCDVFFYALTSYRMKV